MHRESFGENSKLNKYGYPDMGNNIYADQLPYKDWVRINNAQRCHEVGYQQALILFSNAFICALSFPRFATCTLFTYMALRYAHIQNYHSFRGHNRASSHEEFLKLTLVVLAVAAMTSSLAIGGVRVPASLLRVIKRKK